VSYNISIYGHGPDPDDVKEIFENAVRAARAVSPEGSPPVGGSLTAEGISITAADVADTTEAADVDGDEGAGGETDPAAETPAGTEP